MSAAVVEAPSRTTTQHSGRSAQRSSGLAITAASITSGCDMTSFSSSTDEIHSPPDLITSLARSVICTNPRSSTAAMSPVRSQPESNLSSFDSSLK